MKALSPKELAAAIGVSESSLRRWVDSGAIATTRTVGGHRRIPLPEAVRFIRESQSAIVRPELLGLEGPPAGSPGEADPFFEALREGDADAARRRLVGMYLAGDSIATICDGPIRQALGKIGELWMHGPEGILVEHQAIDICIQLLNLLRQMIRPPEPDALLAIGGAPDGDPYLLPSGMAALVLMEAGYRTTNYGPNLPVELLSQAAERHRPRLVWLSVSAAGKADLPQRIEQLRYGLERTGSRLVIGGRVARDLRLPRSAAVCIVHSMAELAAFARGLLPPRA